MTYTKEEVLRAIELADKANTSYCRPHPLWIGAFYDALFGVYSIRHMDDIDFPYVVGLKRAETLTDLALCANKETADILCAALEASR